MRTWFQGGATTVKKVGVHSRQVLKLQSDAFVANCITELLFAFFWDVVVPQVDRSQGPVDPDGQRTKVFNGR